MCIYIYIHIHICMITYIYIYFIFFSIIYIYIYIQYVQLNNCAAHLKLDNIVNQLYFNKQQTQKQTNKQKILKNEDGQFVQLSCFTSWISAWVFKLTLQKSDPDLPQYDLFFPWLILIGTLPPAKYCFLLLPTSIFSHPCVFMI